MPEITLPSSSNTATSDDSKTKKAKQDNSSAHKAPPSKKNKGVKKDGKTVDSSPLTPAPPVYDTPHREIAQSGKNSSQNNKFANSDSGDNNSQPPNNNRKPRRRAPKPPSKKRSKDPLDARFGAGPSGFDPWADPWGDDPWDQNAAEKGSRPSEQKQKMTPQERVSMIEEVYQHVLGRKPDTRDINYYKYSTLNAEEIKSQLLEGKEHSQLLEDGRNYKKMNERADQAEMRVKVLEGQIKDQLEEFRQLTSLLKEKNNLIQQLRVKLNNPYGFSQSSEQRIQEYSKNNTSHYSIDDGTVSKSNVENPQDTFIPIDGVEKSYQPETGTYPAARKGFEETNDAAPTINQYPNQADNRASQPTVVGKPTVADGTKYPNNQSNDTISQFQGDDTSIADSVDSNNQYDNSNNQDLSNASFTLQTGTPANTTPSEDEIEPVKTTVYSDPEEISINSVDDAFDTLKRVSDEASDTISEEYNEVKDSFKARKIIPPSNNDTGNNTPSDNNNLNNSPSTPVSKPVAGATSNDNDISSVIFSSSLPPKEDSTSDSNSSKGGLKSKIRDALSL